MVRVVGLEPTHHLAEEPKSSESTNSTTPAYKSTFIYVLMESTPKPPATFSLSSCHSGGTGRTRTFVVRLTAVSPNHWTTVPNTRRVYNFFNPKLNVYINKFAVYAFWCLEMGSNHLRLALQANALPVELSKHFFFNFLNIL